MDEKKGRAKYIRFFRFFSMRIILEGLNGFPDTLHASQTRAALFRPFITSVEARLNIYEAMK